MGLLSFLTPNYWTEKMFCTYSKHNLALKRIQKNHISLGGLFVKQGLVLKLGKVYNFKNKYYLEIAIIQILLRRNIFLTVVFKNIIVVLSRLKIALVFRLKKIYVIKILFVFFENSSVYLVRHPIQTFLTLHDSALQKQCQMY